MGNFFRAVWGFGCTTLSGHWKRIVTLPYCQSAIQFLEYIHVLSGGEVHLNQRSRIIEGLVGFMEPETSNVNLSMGIFLH